MNCPHDYENDDCTNCANGLPPFHCMMDEERDKKLRDEIHEKAERIEREKLQEFAQWLWDHDFLTQEAFTVRLVDMYKESKEEKS